MAKKADKVVEAPAKIEVPVAETAVDQPVLQKTQTGYVHYEEPEQ